MKISSRILFCAFIFALLLVSWFFAINAKTAYQTQLELMTAAAALTADGIYTRAAPMLEEAAGYKTKNTPAAETELKKVYLALKNKKGYRHKYTDLLEKQMGRKDAGPEIFAEAALYYLDAANIPAALDALKAGIRKTGSGELTQLYEANRYRYEKGRDIYETASAINGTTARVCIEGAWGIASSDGTIIIPCQYERISTFSADRAIVALDGEIFAVDRNNNRIAKLHENASEFGNYASGRIPILLDGGWRRSTGDFVLGSAVFEYIGMYSGNYAPAKTNGKWGVVDLSSKWLIPAEHDGIVRDELGRCYGNGAVFVQNGESVRLYVDGKPLGDLYDDARPFSGETYAAVKKAGKWGFIDKLGNLAIDYRFDDALSFGEHLAAVMQDGLWGYISVSGQIVIDPVFLEAKSFSNGSAPVLTERGWQFITLLEYKSSGPGLFS